ncbi:MAG: hypothetical protein KJ583_04045 [Nanoarchaeota archaeon]|nr:hypothetical protein [Nanoarchaeota archaeon]MBU1270130.1 hypothetical protein [Nanoarchaeota archaeon]MBU1604464.1 hypothetical protein [Nanoarchaeota archaeon]MBU2443473.1 hypothetical protein [Nanoarchaeota archaeon]
MSLIKDFFLGFKEGFMDFGHDVSVIINSLLLSIVYFVGVGLTSIFAKVFKKHFLDLKVNKKKKSYWNDLDLKEKDIEKYYRTF